MDLFRRIREFPGEENKKKKKEKGLGIFKEKNNEWKCTDGYITECSILFSVFLLEKPSKEKI